MLVRVNIGWKAGQIQDIEPVAARGMLADGRASAVCYDDKFSAEEAMEIVTSPATKAASKPAKRTR